ncbi:ANL_collapsed_G0011010.mRNA.1.CDS.1 [Saccharomyces cerevisiae]|nr:ANL_HP_G0185830.mRNA.1.CDS.1 [Saccharomyces cerevisiae]CAI4931920.1 ANL_HP_G0202650.mRNA.1.CDS.1 [Saccharomyces cerevisiae]CAI5204865.1 ANL_HP_G0147810.mRNA.1.CDS.1 [Saccharomyces cerevisiae]CAI5216694.1 ANL_HP_G0180720.mRNA.1.CDS.1 [Saccharomyces cerevisiae]CAI6385183.1 ANL_HP_G0185830.mRNA.1.CDS.1 [Saccharomyces cerevisiae]
MSELLDSFETEFAKFYTDSNLEETNLQKCLDHTHEFKSQLKKLKAHLNKHIQESKPEVYNKLSDKEKQKFKRKRELIIEKLSKSQRQWDHSVKKQIKYVSQQSNRFNKSTLNKLKEFDIDSVYVNKLPKETMENVNEAIGYHILRYSIDNMPLGNKNEAFQYLKDVYGITNKESTEFIEMGQIVHDLKKGDTESCLKWCSNEMESLSSNHTALSSLKFDLYTLSAMQIVKHGNPVELYYQITQNAPLDCFRHREKELMQNVVPLLTKSLIGQPIEDIDSKVNEELRECTSLFIKEYCAAKHIFFDSPLFLIVLSGLISFQFFIKYKTIRELAHVDWTTKDELPFDVKLPDFLTHFHPIFICPVLKEETTTENPPYSLACHHIISKKALDRLSKNGTITFKCPYCPVNTSMSSTKKVRFVML